jgi:hypothetical protein
LLCHSPALGVCCAASQLDATGAQFDEEEHLQRFEVNGFDREAIARQHLLPIVLQQWVP